MTECATTNDSFAQPFRRSTLPDRLTDARANIGKVIDGYARTAEAQDTQSLIAAFRAEQKTAEDTIRLLVEYQGLHQGGPMLEAMYAKLGRTRGAHSSRRARRAALEQFARFKSVAATWLLGRLQSERNVDALGAATDALVEIGQPGVQAAIDGFDAANEDAQLAVLQALAHMPVDDHEASLLSLAKRVLDGRDSDLREAAYELLAHIGSPAAQAMLRARRAREPSAKLTALIGELLEQ